MLASPPALRSTIRTRWPTPSWPRRNAAAAHEERHSRWSTSLRTAFHSSVDGKKVIIGSHHFVFEDEGCVIPEGEQEKFDALPARVFAPVSRVGGVLAAVICIDDPLRAEAGADVMACTRSASKLVMMTGDSERTAAPCADRSALTNTTPRSCRRTRPRSSAASMKPAARSSCWATA